MCPATSKVQQQAMGIAYAAKKGDIPKSKLKGASKNMAKMDIENLHDFAKTKHKGLPKRIGKKKRAKKVSEAFGHKLDIYLQIITRWLENQEFSDFEIDAILNDPNNEAMIESGEAHGINPTLIARDLKTEDILAGQAANIEESEPQKFVAESINEFLSYPREGTYKNDTPDMVDDENLEFAADIFFNEYLPNKEFFGNKSLDIPENLESIIADFSTYMEQNYYNKFDPRYDKTIYKEIVREFLLDPRFKQRVMESLNEG